MGLLASGSDGTKLTNEFEEFREKNQNGELIQAGTPVSRHIKERDYHVTQPLS